MASLAGIEIMVSRHMPTEVIGHHIEAVRAPRWWAWVLSLFGVDDFVCWRSTPMEREHNPMVIAGKLVMSPRQFADIKTMVGGCRHGAMKPNRVKALR